MKIALISDETRNKNVASNLNKIKIHASNLSGKADMVCFGEAFLHGFDALSWSYDLDKKIALAPNSSTITSIRQIAKQTQIAIAFGYFEHDKSSEAIYCSYMVIDDQGECIHNYRRVSIGWKEYKKTDKHYKEGKDFHTLTYKGKKILIALCGDLWYKENIEQINSKKKDFLIWPLHIDYSIEKWTNELELYKKQTNKVSAPIFMVNNISKTSFGGCYYFDDGKILDRLEMGQRGALTVTYS